MTVLRDPVRRLELAFELAEGGRGHVEPNPRVGAVVCSGPRIVGRGFHEYYGGPHAEVVALEEAARAGHVPDAMAVTLEPCSTTGKTPPCVEAIIKSGIRKVYVGATDPNPAHAGRGLAILREHGVEVQHMKWDERFAAQNRPFLRALGRRRPWTILKWAMTLDGRTALSSGDSKWVSGEEARHWVHRLRGRCEGVAVGVSTVLRDDPLLTCRGMQTLKNPPARIIFDSNLRTPPNAKVLARREAPTWLLTLPASVQVQQGVPAAERRRQLDAAGVEWVEIEPVPGSTPPRVDVQRAAEYIYSRGVRRLLVEAGPELSGVLRAARLVDQVVAVVAPRLAGGPAPAPGPAGLPEATRMADAEELDELWFERAGRDWILGGFLHLRGLSA
jgi:diaminohydroxyphosphoribosylaminopyrimidine deaminase/5-amino-6-(5-phosphoribosylamino)uracil reductase